MNSPATVRNRSAAVFVILGAALVAKTSATDFVTREMSPPIKEGGIPLMEALRARRSIRDFSPAPLEPQSLSNLLWAAFGINRPENDHRTAPSGMNAQEMDIYVALADGTFMYDAKNHRLLAVTPQDVRLKTGGGDFIKVAPVALIYVADLARMTKAKPEAREPYAWNSAGYISQNVYLYCASAGLATVVHEIGDRGPLAEALALRPEQKIILAQAVGHPGPPRQKGGRN